MNISKNNKTALITGASSGLGYEFAKLFAYDNFNIVLVARNQEKLEQIAQYLQKNYPIFVKVITKDLTKPKSPDEIYKELQEDGITIDVLVNNAGYATFGLFKDTDLEKELGEIQLNITTLTHLTKLFVQDMVKRGEGKILNIASTAAFFPGPLMAVYYATKAYVLSFSEALGEEVKGTGVSVTVLCPGPTKTQFVKRAHMQESKLFKKSLMDAKTVAKAGYDGLMQQKRVVVPGLQNRFYTEIVRFIPRSLVPRIVKIFQENRA